MLKKSYPILQCINVNSFKVDINKTNFKPIAMHFSRNTSIFLYKFKAVFSKHRIILTILCMLVLILFQLYPIWSFSKKNPDLLATMYADDATYSAKNTSLATYTDENPKEPLVYECCTPSTSNDLIRTNVYFLKTHKTGGSTVQSIIMRFAMMNSLDIMQINYNTYYWPFSDLSIKEIFRTPNKKYNILANHMRYDAILKSYQYPDTPMVTILRHPATLFESLYTFFRMDLTTGKTIQQFINAPVKPAFVWGVDSEKAYRGYNQMSVDLGFDLKQRKSETAVAEFLRKIDREFDFVMITEYMEESIVLFADLMRWPLEYVAFLKLNARVVEEDSYTLTEQDKAILMDLNEIDTLLYDHFLRKFRTCMRQYGEDRLNEQVKQLKIINERFKQRCVAEEVVRLNVGSLERIEYVAKNQSDLECFYSIHVSPQLSKIINKAQSEKLQRLKSR